jgi:hypothetical protein
LARPWLISESQFSTRVIKRNDPLDSAVRFENANLTSAKARAASGVINRMFLTQEHWLNTRRLVHLPAVPEWSDFDDRHNGYFAFASEQRICSIEHYASFKESTVAADGGPGSLPCCV